MPGTERIKFIKERYKDKVGKSFASNLGDIEKVFGEADGFTNSVYELLADTEVCIKSFFKSSKSYWF